MTLGQKIKKIRTDANLTQKDLAEILGVVRLSISQYETGFRTFLTSLKPNLCGLQSGDGNSIYQTLILFCYSYGGKMAFLW